MGTSQENDGQRLHTASSPSNLSNTPRRTHHKLDESINNEQPSNDRSSSPSDAHNLTSFPSLSPSLANTPIARKQHTAGSVSPKPWIANTSQQITFNNDVYQDPLFTPPSKSSGRLALFEDTPRNVRDIPGTLHHQNDTSVEHLIARVGAVKLVKQLSQDLAQRDVQITKLYRKVEERERLLRKMLLECQMTNLEIENRLKELEKSSSSVHALGSRNNSWISDGTANAGLALRATDEGQLGVFISDALSHTINDARITTDETSTSDLTTSVANNVEDISKRSGSPSINNDSRPSSQQSKSSASTGWMSLFRSNKRPTKAPVVSQNSRPKSKVSRRETLLIPETPLRDEQRTSLSSDVYRPPPPTLNRSVSSTASLQDDLVRLSKRETGAGVSKPGDASKSLGSSVKGARGGGLDLDTDKVVVHRERAKTIGALTTETTAGKGSRSVSGKKGRNPLQTSTGGSAGGKSSSPRNSFSSARGRAIGGNIYPDIVRHGVVDNKYPNSPPASISDATNNPGPVEMDTILPEESRPPTLLQYNNYGSSDEYLTDRYGFIYDQRRRKRQSEAVAASIPKSAIHQQSKSISGHRLSIDMFLRHEGINENTLTSSKQTSRPNTPASMDDNDDGQSTKGWQEYLTFSNLKTELLSHTPYTAPITSVTTGEAVELQSGERKTRLQLSDHGTSPAAGTSLLPKANQVVSENAELSHVSDNETTTTASIYRAVSNDPVKALLDQLTEVHDNLQRDRTAKWNDFLRKVRAERRRDGEAFAAHEQRSRSSTMPEDLLADGEVIGVAGLGNKGKVGRAKWNEFRNLVLGGIPVTYRAKVWAECSGASSLRVPGYYDELVNSSFEDPVIVQQIQMDITRTLTDNIFFRKGQGIIKLKEVLLAYARHNPDIGYCQGMNMIVANLLLIMPTAEDAFWILTSMVEKILPEKYYDSSLLTSRADQVVLRQYVSEILPSLSVHLDDLSIELEALTFQWFLSVFTDCLSAEALFRVWDVVLCMNDGASFLFQVAVALLKLNEQALLKCEGPAEIYGYINQKMTDHAISIDGLIRASEGLKKMIQREQIIQRRKEAVEIEERTARERDAIRKGKARQVDPPTQSTKSDTSSTKSGKSSKSSSKVNKLIKHNTLPTSHDPQDNIQNFGELEFRTPMPIEDEFEFRA